MQDQPELGSEHGPVAGPAPWAESAERVLASLEVDASRGLEQAAAEERLRRFGPNLLRTTRSRGALALLWEQFATPIPVLLAVAAAVALAFGEFVEAAAVAAVLVLNGGIGFVTERRAVRSMEALRRLGQAQAVVRRDGEARSVSASELVVGDVLLLEGGDVLAADCRLVEASRLQADESALTGESLPVAKAAEPVAVEAALGERTSMLFKGTALTRGSAEAVVVATGMDTELGRISTLVEAAEASTTPLERRLEGLAHRLIGLTLAIAVVVAVVLFATGRGALLAVETAIALAVATIPEGLPIVATVALARGMWRMARRNALIENLAAVETLGSTTIVLTDKTGTLTENRMTAVRYELAAGAVDVEGTGLDLAGRFTVDGEPLELDGAPELHLALLVGALCNNAELHTSGAEAPSAVGDPTEVALLVAGAKAGLERERLRATWRELGELAFDSQAKRMATLHEHPEGGCFAAVKGAPEELLPLCSGSARGEGVEPLDEAGRQAWTRRADALAAQGQRVLALATRTVADPEAFAFEQLVLVGIVGLFDPPRASARPAVDACREAGIRVVMVTGDHVATAWSVAAAVGLTAPGGAGGPIDCRTLPPASEWSADERERLRAAPVFARSTPEQKLDLIDLHQGAGAVVAMTGDGVNDAPALKKADIGVAMGQRGTQVAREAADMVLKDDELGTIVAAVEQGRAIFANIRKFVVYLLSCNVSEIFVVAVGASFPGPLPILPLQILFLNLVTDVFPALALGVCEGSPALRTAPPRDPGEPLVASRHWRRIFGLGSVLAASVLGAFWMALQAGSDARATTVAFLALALAQLWHVASMRNPRSGVLRNEVTTNPWIWAALALCVLLLLGAVYWSPLAAALSLVDPGAGGWALALGASLVPLLVGQLALLRHRVPPRDDP